MGALVAEGTYNRVGPLQEELFHLLQRVAVIKIMLWAGDYDNARQETEDLYRAYTRVIEHARGLQRHIVSRRRGLCQETEQRYIEQGFKGWRLEYATRLEMAKQSKPEDSEGDSLFVIGPVANLVYRLRTGLSSEGEQIASNTGITQLGLPFPDRGDTVVSEPIVKTDEISGFRFTKSIRDEGSWEYRAYLIDPPALIAERLLENLERVLRVRIDSMDLGTETPSRARELSWPWQLRAFTERAFLDLVFFDSGRFMVQITTGQSVDDTRLFALVLKAVATAQDRQ